jgi:hypothetical protein
LSAGSAHAQVKRSISGSNLRFQIGGELQIPIAATGRPTSCVPKGGIKGINPKKNAIVSTWPTGKFKVQTSAFTLRGPSSNRGPGGLPYTAKVAGVKTQNPVALQVETYFQIQVPFPSMTMTPTMGLYVHKAGDPPAKARKNGGMSGRTGPDVVSWCPGSTATVTMGGNPGCANVNGGGAPVKMPSCYQSPNPCPGPGFMYKSIAGYMKYTRTGKMLGGPANGRLKGPANVVIGATGGGAFVIPLNIGTDPKLKIADPAIGGSIGQVFQQNAGKGPQYLTVMANACGIVNKMGVKVQDKVAENRTEASFGAPLTQGTLTVAAATQLGVEKYVVKGYDKRTAMGAGKLQLVTGSLSRRSLTGANANHGVLTFNVPEPAVAVGTVVALLVLAACHRAMNRRR